MQLYASRRVIQPIPATRDFPKPETINLQSGI